MARKIYDLDSVFRGIAETLRSPKSEAAFKNDTFAYIASQIKNPDSGIGHNDTLVLLGKRDDVVHAIVVRGDEILADRQIDMLDIDSSYDSGRGQYTTKLASGLDRQYVLDAVERLPLQEFYYRHGLEERPQVYVGHDHF